MDEDTLTIGYRDWRGEPRGKQAVAGNGDCIDGMDRIGKLRDLIGYLALPDEVRERAGQPAKPVWTHVFRPRTVLYTLLWAGVGVALFLRTEIDVNVTPVRNPTFVMLSDGSVRNTNELRLRNKNGDDRWFTVPVTSVARLAVAIEGAEGLRVLVPANETLAASLYITAAAGSVAAGAGRTGVTIWIEDQGTGAEPGTDRVHKDTIFNGKGN
jgi:polyferredoxin